MPDLPVHPVHFFIQQRFVRQSYLQHGLPVLLRHTEQNSKGVGDSEPQSRNAYGKEWPLRLRTLGGGSHTNRLSR